MARESWRAGGDADRAANINQQNAMSRWRLGRSGRGGAYCESEGKRPKRRQSGCNELPHEQNLCLTDPDAG
jgi:hypothetical protein